MIKIVPDTNIILSGILGKPGPTRRIIDLALDKKILLYGSQPSYAEFCEKITHKRFQAYLKKQIYTPEKIILDYRFFINIVDTKNIYGGQSIVTRDPDDDEYFKIAKACNSQVIITRDADLLDIKKYDGIIAVTPEKYLTSLRKLHGGNLF